VHVFLESLGDIRGYYPPFGPYYAYAADGLRKIMWNVFFNHAVDFSMTFGKFKRTPTSFALSFLVFSRLHHCEMHAITFDKLLRALTVSEPRIRLLSHMEEWLMLLESLVAS